MSKIDWIPQYGSDQQQEVNELGSSLSLAISCAVHYPAFDKHMFECKCGVVFPVYLVRRKDWIYLSKKHEEEKVLV